MNPASTVSCTNDYTADGKKFLNAPGYAAEATGDVPLTTAVAHSCNTAFVSQFEKLGQDKLADAAGALGIGMTNDLGLDAFTGDSATRFRRHRARGLHDWPGKILFRHSLWHP